MQMRLHRIIPIDSKETVRKRKQEERGGDLPRPAERMS